MKLAWQRAKEWMERQGVSFEELLGRYVAEGHYVWSSPTEFILAAEVQWHQDSGEYSCSPSPNAWFLHLAATADGSPLRPEVFLRLAPRPHPWVLFHRRDRLRVHRWDQFADRQTFALPVNHGK